MNASPQTTSSDTSTADREIVTSRVFAAPRELVFDVWTRPEHLVKWWGPNGFTTTMKTMDVRPGGAWHFVMHGPDGTDFKNESVFVDVQRPERLVYDHVAPRFRSTVTFTSEGSSTRVTMRMVFDSAEEFERTVRVFGAIEGAKQTFARLAAYVEAQQSGEIVLTRLFAAPRARVFEAWTQPEHLKRWWAPNGCSTPVVTVDLRVGGKLHYCMRLPDGAEIWGVGIYREVVAPSRIVYMDAFADAQGNLVQPSHYGMSASHPAETLVSVSFDEEAGQTRVTLRHSIPPTVTERDATAQGWTDMLERLAASLSG